MQLFTWNFSKFKVNLLKIAFWPKCIQTKNFCSKTTCSIYFKFGTHIFLYVSNKSIRGIFNILIKTKNIAKNVSPHPIFLLKCWKFDEKNHINFENQISSDRYFITYKSLSVCLSFCPSGFHPSMVFNTCRTKNRNFFRYVDSDCHFYSRDFLKIMSDSNVNFNATTCWIIRQNIKKKKCGICMISSKIRFSLKWYKI